jgi:hypothetical protein
MSSRLGSPQDALQRLIEGNQRFVCGKPIYGKVREEAFTSLNRS